VGQLSFEVREVHQGASGGSHVVKYSAEIEFLDGPQPFSVEIISVYPRDGFSSEATEISRQMIQRGAARAFDGTGKSARIPVRDFVIHPGRLEAALRRGVHLSNHPRHPRRSPLTTRCKGPATRWAFW
jgi:hypothetical protein